MDVLELNKDYLDLYGDSIKVIELEENPTFTKISSYFEKTDSLEREFKYKEKRIVAKRKVVIQRGCLKSNYLHILIEDKKYSSDNVRYSYYREQKDGTFKFMGFQIQNK